MSEEQYTSAKTGCSTCSKKAGKLDVFDWLADLPEGMNTPDLVEVRFKNTRKLYFKNATQGKLAQGDIVAVEATPGHDIGEVVCTGEMVVMQMKKNNISMRNYEFKRVYRKAKPLDLEKWEESKGLEKETMLEARRIAQNLKLEMKIGDVEYQGDRTKAIFYYIADERVDFRELIKVLADRFKVRIEMRQIGARQEAGRIGGIGPCGRELCCSSWMTNFVSVTTNSARYQEISLNPQKLAGQCGKLKCCLNYELDAYLDAQQDFPRTNIPIETAEGTYYHFKTDIFKRIMWYSSDSNMLANVKAVSVDRVKEIIALNKTGKKADILTDEDFDKKPTSEIDYQNVVGQDSLTRFDETRKKSGNNNNNRNKKRPSSNRVGGPNDRPLSERPQSDTTPSETPQVDRPQGERPQGNRPQGNRPQGNRPQGDRPQGNRPQGDRRPNNQSARANTPGGARTERVERATPQADGANPSAEKIAPLGEGAPRTGNQPRSNHQNNANRNRPNRPQNGGNRPNNRQNGGENKGGNGGENTTGGNSNPSTPQSDN